MNFKIYYYIGIIILLLSSCQKKEQIGTNNNLKNIDNSIVNGRFIFSSKQSIHETIEGLKKYKLEKLENKFAKLYEKGFRSYKPIVAPDNELLQTKLSEERYNRNELNKKYNSNSIIEEEDIIADPFLASIVNNNNEIIINDTIYKFTNKGLYFSHIKDSTLLFNYLDKNINSPLSKKIGSDFSPCGEREINGGITITDDERVLRYIRPMIDDCDDYTEGGGNNSSYPKLSEDERLRKLINNLPITKGDQNWFQDIFGKRYSKTIKFDSRHRVQVEFWDQDWKFYTSVGVQVKTQKRVLGTWWKNQFDEIHLGINRIFLKYNYSQPDISSITHPDLFNSTYKAPIYSYKGEFKVKKNLLGQHYVKSKISVKKINLPFFEFENSDILNIYIPNIPIVGDYNLNLTTQDILSQSNIKALYKMGIDFVEDNFNSGAKKEFVISYQKNINELEVLYFGEHYKYTDRNHIKRYFYKDFSGKVSVTLNGESDWNYKLEPAPETFRNYTHYELDFYGMARRNNIWKGTRMIR